MCTRFRKVIIWGENGWGGGDDVAERKGRAQNEGRTSIHPTLNTYRPKATLFEPLELSREQDKNPYSRDLSL